MLYDVINHNSVISAADLYQPEKNERFSGVQIVENIVVKYVKAGNFWDVPRTVAVNNKTKIKVTFSTG